MVPLVYNIVLGMLVLVLSNQWLSVAVVGMSLNTPCSNSVSLTENVNGNISFEPGKTIANGSSITIHCHGIHAQPPKKANPAPYTISRINIFGPKKELLDHCTRHSGIRDCQYKIPQMNVLGVFTYHCQFIATFTRNSLACVSSKNLTVTVNECLLSPSPCHREATCEKTNSSFQCKCNNGFTGDGKNCTDIQECLEPSSCPANADCFELRGSFECICKRGFFRDGKDCRRTPSCIFNSTCMIENDLFNCKSTDSSDQRCHCRKNFIGNGTHCILAIPKPGPSTSNGDSSKIIIIVGVVVSLTLLIIFALSLSFYHKRKIIRQGTSNRAVNELNKGRMNSKNNLEIIYPEAKKDVESSPRRKLPSIREHNIMEEEPVEDDIMSYICVLDDWEIDRNDLTVLDKKLGGGYFGVVKKGIYKDEENDSITVAVKMLKDSPSAADRTDLLMELHILKEVNKNPHPNVIQLIGAFTSEEPILVITEFCARGNLRNLLRKSRLPIDNNEDDKNSSEYTNIFSTLSHKILLQMAVDTASGMQHLAANQFVHRDLSARNILIGANYEAKVSDFGLARPITGIDQMYVKSNRNLLPVKWMAVESLTRGVFRTSSDVWAFGVVLWEITTLGDEPYPEISPFETFTLVASGKRMERPPQCCEELYGLMSKCWEHDHEKRPSFEEIHGELKEMLKETDNRVYINVIELQEQGGDMLQDDRRISVESIGNIRYTKG